MLQQAVREGRVPLVHLAAHPHAEVPGPARDAAGRRRCCCCVCSALGPFVVVNTLLLYAAGCAGLLRLRRRYGLSLLPAFAFLFLAFMLNGHVTRAPRGRAFDVGGLSSCCPLFALPVLDLVEDGPRARRRS